MAKHSAILLLLLTTITTTFLPAVFGFVVAPVAASQKQRKPISSPLLSAAAGWEDLVYNAQSAASDLASLSLQEASLSSLPIMYGAGLLASVSPCVWGLLPLTMSYISTAAGAREDKQATLPTLAFAAGLAAVFCTLGLVAASVGGLFGRQEGLTDVVVSVLSSGICLAMGFQLLEFVELPLPSFNIDVLADAESEISEIHMDDDGNMIAPTVTNKNQGSLVRTFLLGGSSALVSTPCATPVLTSILGFVANSHDPVLGAVLLLGYTLGYSTPLLLVASTGGQFLANLDDDYGKIAGWITPLTGGILLWYGTNGMLTAIFGDPSLVGLAPILE